MKNLGYFYLHILSRCTTHHPSLKQEGDEGPGLLTKFLTLETLLISRMESFEQHYVIILNLVPNGSDVV